MQDHSSRRALSTRMMAAVAVLILATGGGVALWGWNSLSRKTPDTVSVPAVGEGSGTSQVPVAIEKTRVST